MSGPITRQHWWFGAGVVIVAGAVGWLGGRLGGAQVTAPALEAPAQEQTEAPAVAPRPRSSAGPARAELPERGALRPVMAHRAVAPETDGDARERTLVTLTRAGDMASRAEALFALRNEYPERSVEVARELVASRDPEVAHQAASVLIQEKSFGPDDVAAMQDVVQDPKAAPELRAGANAAVMMMVRETGGPELEAWARKSYQSDVAWVRGATVAAIAPMPSERAVPLLAEALNDPDPAVAAGALNALVGMHGGDEKLGKDADAWKKWVVEREAARKKAEEEALALRDARPAVIPGSAEAPTPPAPPEYPPTVESPAAPQP